MRYSWIILLLAAVTHGDDDHHHQDFCQGECGHAVAGLKPGSVGWSMRKADCINHLPVVTKTVKPWPLTKTVTAKTKSCTKTDTVTTTTSTETDIIATSLITTTDIISTITDVITSIDTTIVDVTSTVVIPSPIFSTVVVDTLTATIGQGGVTINAPVETGNALVARDNDNIPYYARCCENEKNYLRACTECLGVRPKTKTVTASRSTVYVTATAHTTTTTDVTASTTTTTDIIETSLVTIPDVATSFSTEFDPTTTFVDTTIAVPTEEISTMFVTITTDVCDIEQSATLSVYTGTTSFVDSFTTIFEPVIILTTLVATITVCAQP